MPVHVVYRMTAVPFLVDIAVAHLHRLVLCDGG